MESVHRNVVSRLIGLGLVSESRLVDGSVILGTGRQRNRFYYFRQREAPSFFVKQACGESGAETTLDLEAKVYQCASASPDCSELRSVMPQLIHFDQESSTLITQMFVNSQDMGTAIRSSKHLDLQLIRAFGSAAAVIHDSPIAPFQAGAQIFDGRPHWIYRLCDDPSPLPSLRGRSQASSQLIDEILVDKTIMEALAGLRGAWSTDSLVHGDYKWENALVLDDAERSVRIIDWEQANIGDPAWDIAYGLGAIVVHDAMTAKEAPGNRNPVQLAVPMRSFWQAYLHARRGDGEDALELLERAVSMMAARLLVAAFELCYSETEIPAISRLLLRSARAVFDGGGREIVLAIHSARESSDHE